MLKIALIS